MLAEFSQLAGEFQVAKNGTTPDKVAAGSETKYWWQCSKAGHEWEASAGNRVRAGASCPYCSGLRTAPNNSLKATFPELAAEFMSARNGITPDKVGPGV